MSSAAAFVVSLTTQPCLFPALTFQNAVEKMIGLYQDATTQAVSSSNIFWYYLDSH